MAFLMLEDINSSAEVILFPSTFKKVESYLGSYQIFIVKGALDAASPHKCKIKANECIPIDLFLQEWPHIQKIVCSLPAPLSESLLTDLKAHLASGTVPLEFIFTENGKRVRLATREKISVTNDVLALLDAAAISAQIVL